MRVLNMRLPRMTTRRWMIAAATVAVVLGFRADFERRRKLYELRAVALERDGLRAQVGLIVAEYPGRGCVDVSDLLRAARGSASPYVVPVVDPVAMEVYRRRALYYRGLRDKYKNASRFPWLPVAPDPPAP
jgi:hypothetical protein